MKKGSNLNSILYRNISPSLFSEVFHLSNIIIVSASRSERSKWSRNFSGNGKKHLITYQDSIQSMDSKKWERELKEAQKDPKFSKEIGRFIAASMKVRKLR